MKSSATTTKVTQTLKGREGNTKGQLKPKEDSDLTSFYKQGAFFMGMGRYPAPSALTEKLI